ncbi:RAD51-associated protein 1 [Candoia aspera]|uniref:RAD51-associated protein 1 n=1 Tax=Candoia aspera TaxID=51853 RepID=UPI002FD85C2D
MSIAARKRQRPEGAPTRHGAGCPGFYRSAGGIPGETGLKSCRDLRWVRRSPKRPPAAAWGEATLTRAPFPRCRSRPEGHRRGTPRRPGRDHRHEGAPRPPPTPLARMRAVRFGPGRGRLSQAPRAGSGKPEGDLPLLARNDPRRSAVLSRARAGPSRDPGTPRRRPSPARVEKQQLKHRNSHVAVFEKAPGPDRRQRDGVQIGGAASSRAASAYASPPVSAGLRLQARPSASRPGRKQKRAPLGGDPGRAPADARSGAARSLPPAARRGGSRRGAPPLLLPAPGMARRSGRSGRAAGAARLEEGDEDEDFAAPPKRPRPPGKRVPLDDKLFQRDLEVTLALSLNEYSGNNNKIQKEGDHAEPKEAIEDFRQEAPLSMPGKGSDDNTCASQGNTQPPLEVELGSSESVGKPLKTSSPSVPKKPSWTPPAALGGKSSQFRRVPVKSPVHGLRLGLSRFAKVKPLHPHCAST